ncbi:hypothetical protein BJ878DRAFT_197091 [Calycina marina]|uniref:JmjC domain-containing protein n=1 Tax=Calycina marina TaxID=1763456 RepID=A0A9P7YYB2_9HELO|nr:hypothetical protein BJ878DRAFT_197091 [Calycina marina]
MRLQTLTTKIAVRYSKKLYSTSRLGSGLPAVSAIDARFDELDVSVFRQRAFLPEQPLLIRKPMESNAPPASTSACSISAATKWFSTMEDNAGGLKLVASSYLSSFGDVLVPYELIYQGKADVNESSNAAIGPGKDWSGTKIRRFERPLSTLLSLSAAEPELRPQLYIAQAQLSQLPESLQKDIPTPHLVSRAGKGDIYDANLWMGLPPTYTPLHKDPNPNLFVQLASNKRVRLFAPPVGAAIFRHVQSSIGKSASASFRGEEMMEGSERAALYDAVWRTLLSRQGFEAVVSPGDALFIPKGWWHSIRSMGTDLNASVNWWFR